MQSGVVGPAFGSISGWWVVSFCWGPRPDSSKAAKTVGEGEGACALGISVWHVGQLDWEASHLHLLLAGGELYLGLWSLLGLYGRAGHGKDCWVAKCISEKT